jgi:hypothetical protein
VERRIRSVLFSRSGVVNIVVDNVSCDSLPITLSINDNHQLVICKGLGPGEKIGKKDVLYLFDDPLVAIDFCKSLHKKNFYREEVHFYKDNGVEYYQSFRLKVDDDLSWILKPIIRSLK